jgi:hypothetical protein
MNDFHRFSKKMQKLSKELSGKGVGASFANEVAKDSAIILLRELVYRTPVDTSKALSNWRVSVGRKPRNASLKPIVEGEKGSSRFESAEIAVAKGISKIKLKKANQKIYISNTLDYIDDLDRGKSMQAPRGFVDESMVIAQLKIQKKMRSGTAVKLRKL